MTDRNVTPASDEQIERWKARVKDGDALLFSERYGHTTLALIARVERSEAECAKLREALREIEEGSYEGCPALHDESKAASDKMVVDLQAIARAALADKGGEE